MGWIFVVFPALIMNYLGQGALILRSPTVISQPFLGLFSKWAAVPMVVVAVVATMIASQAVITGAFSVTQRAVQLSYPAWARGSGTSRDTKGRSTFRR